MWRFALRRVGHFVLGLVFAVVLAASVSSLATNDGGPAATPAANISARLVGIAHFDFGASVVTAAPAWSEVAKRLPVTLELVSIGGLIALAAGTIAGAFLSERRTRRLGIPLLQVVSALPVFCGALGLLWLSQRLFHWAGTVQSQSLIATLEPGNVGAIESALRALALPALTVGLAGAYSVQSVLRRAIARAAKAPYRKGLRALGLGRFEVDRLYFLPQVFASFFSGLGEIVSSLFAAAAIAEWVFDWPGAADLFLKSVALRDWTVVAVVLFIVTAVTMMIDFAGAIAGRILADAEVVT